MSSYGRVKTLTVMIEAEELNISEVTRRAGLSHTSTSRHLEYLVKSGLLTEKRFNRIRIFRINRGSPMVAALERFVFDWKAASESSFQRVYG